MALFRHNMKLYFTEYLIKSLRKLSTAPSANKCINEIEILGRKYPTESWTNITPKVISLIGKNLHVAKYHPLSLVQQQIVNYFYKAFVNRIGNPKFSVYTNLNPVVTVEQNFDSLFVPKDHVSRNNKDCYYINRNVLLRAHMTAHQAELITMGLNNFLTIGDVYRRDDIDSTHYPVFHQVDATRLCTVTEVFQNVKDSEDLQLFEHNGIESTDKQACHSLEAVQIMGHELKNTLLGLVQTIFGNDVKYRWVDQYFPFTHPSWELEVFCNDKWIEILGCGIIRHEILQKSGAGDRIGWAFGLGLDRLAMILYNIPDIRLFWSTDSGFLSQFKVDDPYTPIQYKPISIYPHITNDMSFWLPEVGRYSQADYYNIVKDIGGDMVEQVYLLDEFVHPKTNKTSHCYRIIYRHMERNLTQKEVTEIHTKIKKAVTDKLNAVLR